MPMNQSSSERTTTMSQVTPSRPTNCGNRVIQPRPNHHLRPLRPHNTNNTTPRDMYRSMIPVRARATASTAPVTPTNVVTFHINNLQPQHRPHQRPPRQRPLPPTTTSTTANATHQALAMSLSETQTILQSVESAFNVYGERLQADLRDFRALCTTLVAKEYEERVKWHSLCLKMMKQRDAASQKVHDLVSSSLASPRNLGKGKGKMVPDGAATMAASAVSMPSSPRGSKRAREEVNSTSQDQASTSPPRSSTSPALMSQTRPICNIKTTASPVHSPPGSPYTPTSPLLPPLSSSTETDISIPPVSAASSTEVVSPVDGTATVPFTSASFASVTNMATGIVNPQRASGSRSPSLPFSISSSLSSSSSSSFRDSLTTAEEEQAPPMKRRKSCESRLPQSETMTLVASAQDEDVKPILSYACTEPPLKVQKPLNIHLPSEFLHVDIMYVPMNGKLVCRACLLNSTKRTPPPENALAEPNTNCKSFPTNASWDDLREHCMREHPDACTDVARLHPAEVFELRRRLNM